MSSSASPIPSLAGGFLGAVLGVAVIPDHSGGLVLGALAGYTLVRGFDLTRRIEELERASGRLSRQLDEVDRRAATGTPTATPPMTAPLTPARQAEVVDIDITPQPPETVAADAPRWELEPPAAPERDVPAPVPVDGWMPPPAAAPDTPGPMESVVRAIRGYFTDGNTLVRSGVVILLCGVAFLLRYVAEHTHLPIELRLASVTAGAVALAGLGWRWRRERPAYALALQGAGVGIIYLVIFAAFRWYALLPGGIAFALLALTAATSVVLAIVQDSQPFAVLSVFGAFLAPLLAAGGAGSHVALFSYYTLVDLGILAMLWFRPWQALAGVGFVTTLLISTWWGTLRYEFEYFLTTEPFLAVFFAIFLAIAIRSTLRRTAPDRHYLDAGLLFANPLVTFALQAALLGNRPLPLAYSAVVLGGIYIGLAFVLRQDRAPAARFLVECFAALGAAFVTLAVPLAVSGAGSATVWAFEGLALTWVGCRRDHPRSRWAGVALSVLAIVLWVVRGGNGAATSAPISAALVNGLLVALAILATSLLLGRFERQGGRPAGRAAALLFVLGSVIWVTCGTTQIGRLVTPAGAPFAALAFIGASALAAGVAYGREPYAGLRYAALGLLPFMALIAWVTSTDGGHPLALGGWLVWPAAFAALFFLMRRLEVGGKNPGFATIHALTAWLLAAVTAAELAWQVRTAVAGAAVWSEVIWALVPAAAIGLIVRLAESARWPMRHWRDAYLRTAATGFAVFLAVWTALMTLGERGDPAPLPYLPLLNPLDITMALAGIATVRHFLALRRHGLPAGRGAERDWITVFALVAFVAVNGMLLRALSALGNIPYTTASMLRSGTVQAAISVFWALLALSVMLVASRIRQRAAWMAGATLLVVVVAKLFLVDAANIGTIDRIVSFIGVGLLMLVIGYFLPLPPAAAERR